MPQIKSLDYIWEKGIPVRESYIELGALSTVQEDFSRKKIDEIKMNIEFCKLTVWDVDPIFISHNADPIVIDGNHRYMAFLEMFGPRTVVPCFVIDLTFAQALNRLKMISEAYSGYRGDEISRSEFRYIEQKLDDLFNVLGLDVEFTKHFKERMNQRSIKVSEMIAAMKSLFQRFGDKLSKWKDGTERVLRSMATDIHIPFILYKNSDGMVDIVLKTIMKKRNFLTNTPYLNVESKKLGTNSGIIKEFNDFLTKAHINCEYIIGEGNAIAILQESPISAADLITEFSKKKKIQSVDQAGVLVEDQGKGWWLSESNSTIKIREHETPDLGRSHDHESDSKVSKPLRLPR